MRIRSLYQNGRPMLMFLAMAIQHVQCGLAELVAAALFFLVALPGPLLGEALA